jgi:hypothetical protein
LNSVLKYKLYNFVSKLEDNLFWPSIVLSGIVIYLGIEIVWQLPLYSPSSSTTLVQVSATLLIAGIWGANFITQQWFMKSPGFAWFKRARSSAFTLERKILEFLEESKIHLSKITFTKSEIENVHSGVGRFVDRESNRGGWMLYEHFLYSGQDTVELSGASISIVDNIKTHFGPTGATSVTTANTTLLGEFKNNQTSTQIHYGHLSTGSAIIGVSGGDGTHINLTFGSSGRAKEVFDQLDGLISVQARIKKNAKKTIGQLEIELENLTSELPPEQLRMEIKENENFLGEALSAYLGGVTYEAYRELLAETGDLPSN